MARITQTGCQRTNKARSHDMESITSMMGRGRVHVVKWWVARFFVEKKKKFFKGLEAPKNSTNFVD